MDLKFFIERFGTNAGTIQSMVQGLSVEQARWKPAPDEWSILEVVGHLYDEERFDFRVRLDYTLHRPGEKWPPFDQLAWVTEHEYNEQDLSESLGKFLDERTASVEWLRKLRSPRWDDRYSHPSIGDLRAGDLLAAWLAHDSLHIRQLAGLQVDYVENIAAPYNVRYAKP